MKHMCPFEERGRRSNSKVSQPRRTRQCPNLHKEGEAKEVQTNGIPLLEGGLKS